MYISLIARQEELEIVSAWPKKMNAEERLTAEIPNEALTKKLLDLRLPTRASKRWSDGW